MIYGEVNEQQQLTFFFSKDTHEQHEIHSKSDNIENKMEFDVLFASHCHG